MSYIIVNSTDTYSDYIDLKNLKINRSLKEGEKQDLHEVSGSITFFGLDYDRIYTIYTAGTLFIDFDAYNDLDIIQGSGQLEIQGIYDEDKKVCTLSVINNDKYQEIWKNYGTDYNILENNADIINVFAITQKAKLEFKATLFTENDGLGSVFYINSAPYYARQNYEATDLEVSILTNRDGWQLKDGTTNTLIRDWTGVFPAMTDDKLIFFGTGGVINDQLPDNTAYLSAYTYITGGLCINNNLYYGGTYVFYSNFVFVKDVIKYLFSQIDATVTFVEDGTDTDSFGFLNKYTQFNYLAICDIASVLTQNGQSKTFPSSIANLSLEKLMTLFKEYFGAYWYIDSSKVFYLKQFTDFTLTASVLPKHDLTNLYGFNFSENVKRYKINNSQRYDRIITKTTSGLIDFIGVDMVFPNIKTTNAKAINIESFFFDINDIANYPSRYNENSIDQFFMACLNTAFTQNVVYFFENSGTFPCTTGNGLALAAGEIIFSTDATYLEITNLGTTTPAATANIWTNAFSAVAGDSLSIYYNLTNRPDPATSSFLIMLVIADDLDVNTGQIVAYLSMDEGANSDVITAPITSNKYRIYFFSIPFDAAPSFDIDTFRVYNDNYYQIRQGTGALTLKTNISNVELSTANMQDEGFYSQMSDTNVTINNINVDISTDYLNKFKELDEITIPCQDFVNDFNLTDYVNADISADCEIENIDYDIINNKATIKLKF